MLWNDGYLTDADFQNSINNQLSAQSFIDYYTMAMEFKQNRLSEKICFRNYLSILVKILILI